MAWEKRGWRLPHQRVDCDAVHVIDAADIAGHSLASHRRSSTADACSSLVTFAKWDDEPTVSVCMGVLLIARLASSTATAFRIVGKHQRGTGARTDDRGDNALLLPIADTANQRGVAFATSAFFAGMLAFGIVVLVPLAFAGFMRHRCPARCNVAIG